MISVNMLKMIVNQLVQDIFSIILLLFPSVLVMFAHERAKFSSEHDGSFEWTEDFPVWISSLVG